MRSILEKNNEQNNLRKKEKLLCLDFFMRKRSSAWITLKYVIFLKHVSWAFF